MKTLEDMIKALVLEGKSDEEIAAAVAKVEEAQKMTTDAVAALIAAVQAGKSISDSLSASKKLKAEADARIAAEKEADVKIEKRLNDKLKSIGINPTSQFGNRDLKFFNTMTGKMEAQERVSEMYGKANDMIIAVLNKDTSSALSMSKEISEENSKIRAERVAKLGIKVTPSVSDVVARGGYAIPTEVDDMITQQVYAESVMLQNANKETIIVNDKLYPVMYGTSVVYIADQSTAVTESNPTFYNPTVSMKRVGAYSAISNKIINQKGADLVNAFMLAYKSDFARFLDLHMAVGCVTNNADLQDGLVFDPNTVLDTPVALATLTLAQVVAMTQAISGECEKLVWIGNRKVRQTIGLLENTAGMNLFPQFIGGGDFSPLGIPFIENTKIPSVLDVGADKRTTGTDDVLILADMSKVACGIDGETRIDLSTDFLFTSDATVLRGIRSVGWKVLMGNTQASGGVVRALELTN